MKNSFFKKSSASLLGRMSMVVVMLFLTSMLHAQNTYFWVGGASGSYTANTSWSTTRGGTAAARTPASTDVLVIDGNNVGAGVTASAITISNLSTETIGYLYINQKSATATTVTFSSNSATLTIANDLALAASCTLADGGNTFIVKGSLAAANTGGVTVHSGTGKIIMDGTGTKSSVGYITVGSAGSGYTISATTIGIAWTSGATYNIGDQVSSGGYLYTVTSATGSNNAGTAAPNVFGGTQAATGTGANAVYTFAGIAATASNTAAGAQSTTAQAFTISQGGCGYTSAPAVTVAGGTGGSFTANLVNAIALTNNGSTMSVGNMDISNGANILLAANMNFNVNGQLDLKTSGNLALNNRSLFFNSTSATSGSTGTIATAGGTVSAGIGPSTTSVFTGGTIQFNGSFDVGSVQTVNFPTTNASACALTNFQINRTANCSVKFGTAFSTKLTLGGGFTVGPASGSATYQFDDGGNTIAISGNPQINITRAVTVKFVSSGGKIQASRTAAAELSRIVASGTLAIDNLEISSNNTSGYTVAAGTTINKSLTFTGGGVLNGNNLTIGDGTNPVAITVTAGGFAAAAPTFTAGSLLINLTYNNATNTVLTTGYEMPTVASGLLNNLTLSGAGSVVLGANVKVGNTLAFTNTGSLNPAAFTLTVAANGTISRTGTGNIVSGALSSAAITSGNTNYTVGPTSVSFSGGGGGSGAAASVTMGTCGSLSGGNGGAGYTVAPTFTVSGGGGTGLVVGARISGGVLSYYIINPGSGYTTAPTLAFVGGTYTTQGTVPIVVLANNLTFTLTNMGSGYTSAPSMSLTGGTGGLNGATLASTISSPTNYPVYGALNTDKVNITAGANITSGNELLGGTGKVGTLKVTGGVTYTLGTISANNLSLDAITVDNSGGVLDAGANSISENPSTTLSVNNTGTIKTSNTGTTPLPASRTWNGTVNYNAASGTQTVVTGNYTNLTLGAASSTATFNAATSASIAVSGALTVVTANNTFDLGTTGILTSVGSVSNAGNINIGVLTSTSATPIPAGVNWGSSGKVSFTGVGAQTLPTGSVTSTFYNLDISTTGSPNTVSMSGTGTINVSNTLSFGTGTPTLVLGSSNTLGINGSVTPTTGGTGNINAINGTVSYGGTSAQTIAANTFTSTTISNISGTARSTVNNLVINNNNATVANQTVTLSVPLYVTGTLTLTAGRLVGSSSNYVIVTSTSAPFSGGSATSYVDGGTSSSPLGPLGLYFSGSYGGGGSFKFPVGSYSSGNNYYPLTLNAPTTSGAVTLTAQAYAGTLSGNVDGTTLASLSTFYWTLGSSSATNFTGATSIGLYSATASNTNNNIAVAVNSYSGSSYATNFSSLGESTFSSNTVTSSTTNPTVVPTITNTSNPTKYTIAFAPTSYGITSVAASSPTYSSSIQSSTANSGFYGQTITIQGSGFSSNTKIKFNGGSYISPNSGSLSLSTPNSFTVNVPDGITTGTLTISDDGGTTTTTSPSPFTVLGYISNGDGDWNQTTPSIWLNGVAPNVPGAPVTINSNVGLAAAAAISPSSLNISSIGKLTFSNSNAALTVSTSFTNNGTIDQNAGGTLTFGAGVTTFAFGTFSNNSGANGTIVINGTTAVTGTLPTFNNLTVGGGTVTLSSSPTINGNLTYTASTASLSKVPNYGVNSTLVYNSSYSVASEWGMFPTSGSPIANVQVTNPGSGYINVPTVSFATTTGTTATATANLGVYSITLTGNTGYTSVPTVTIDPPPAGGTQATAVAFVGGTASSGTLSIAITNNGSGYTTPPTVTISGGGGSATAQASLGVFSITLGSGGSSYTSSTVTITPTNGGSGCVATALPTVGLGVPANVTISSGTVSGINSARTCSGKLSILNSATFNLANTLFIGTSLSNGGTLSADNNATLDLAGNRLISLGSSGTFNATSMNGTMRSSSNNSNAYQYAFPPNASWGGTIVYYAATTSNTRIIPGTYTDVNLDNGIANTINFDNPPTVNGLTSNAKFIFNGNVTYRSGNTFSPRFCSVTFGGSNQTIPTNTYYDLAITGSGCTFPSGTVNIAGSFTLGSGSGNTAASGSTINFNGNYSQTIPGFNYYNLTISGTSRNDNVTLSGTIGVAGTLSHTATYSSIYIKLLPSTSTINYNGTGASTVAAISYNNLTISGTRASTSTITLQSGTIDVAGTFSTSQSGTVTFATSGNILNLNGNVTSTISSPFTYQILNLTAGTLNINATTTGNGLATVSSGATISVGATYTNTGGLTQNGYLNMNGGSLTVSPSYSSSATLVYKTAATVGNEWIAGGTLGNGVPQTITVDAGSSTVTTPATLRTIIGDLSIVSGTLSLGGNLQVNGNWTDNGTFTPNLNTVTFGGSSTSYIYTPETFYNLQISDAVTLNSPVTVTGVLTLSSGVLTTTSSYSLSVTNSSSNAIVGGSASAYIDGPLTWSLPNGATSSTYIFPLGSNSSGTAKYLPFKLINPTTNNVSSATVTAFGSGNSTGFDNTLSSISTNYWILTNPTSLTKSDIALAGAATSSLVAVKLSLGANYASSGGAGDGYFVSTDNPSTNPISLNALQYFCVGAPNALSLQTSVPSSPYSGQLDNTGYIGQKIIITGTRITTNTIIKIGASFNSAITVTFTESSSPITITVPNNAVSGKIYATESGVTSSLNFTVLGYVSKANNSDWNSNGTWLGDNIPSANSSVLVLNNIYINSPVSNSPSNVTVASGAAISFGAVGALTVNTSLSNAGSINLPTAGSSLTLNGSFNNTGTFTPSAGSVTFAVGNATQTIPAATYKNLSVTNTAFTVSAGGALVVNGVLNIANNAILDLGTNALSGTLTTSGTGTLYAGSNTTTPVPSGITWNFTVNYTGSASQTVVDGSYTNLYVSARTGSNVTLINGATISVSGIFSPGTLTSGSYQVTGNTFSFNGASAQSIPAFTFTNLTIANSNGITSKATGALVVNTALQINDGATLDMDTYQLTGAFTTSNNSGSGTGTLKTQNTTTTPIPTGKTWNFGVTYYYPSGTQTVMAGTYNGTLNSAGTSGTNTVSGAITVNGALLIGANHTLSMLTNAMSTTSASTFDPSGISGTLLTTNTGSSATVYQFPANKTWGGKVVYGGASTTKLVPGVFNNLDLDNGGTVTSAAMNLDGVGGTSSTATFEVRGTLSMSAASAITVANNTTFKFTGTNQVLPPASITLFNVIFGTGTNLQAGTNLTIQNTFNAGTTTTINAGMITFNPTASSSASILIPNIKYSNLNISGTVASANTIGFASNGDVQVAGSFLLNSKYSYTISNNIKLLGTLQPVTNVAATISGTTITCATAGLEIGMTVVGTGIISSNTTITKVNSTLGTITVSSTATTGSTTLSFYPTLSLYQYSTGTTNIYSGTLTIPNSTFYSPVSSFTNANGAIMQNSGTWNILGGNYSNNITITGSGVVRLANGALSLSGIGTFSNLTIDNGAVVTIQAASMLNITGTLKVINSGTLNMGTNGLTLKSTSIANTAVVDQVGGTITGTATVERYIPMGYRAYRDMAPEVYNAGSIFSNWQEGGVTGANLASNTTIGKTGIFITGASAADPNTGTASSPVYSKFSGDATTANPAPNSNGLDYSINGINSAFLYNNITQNGYLGWGSTANASAITNTNTTQLDAFRGYRVLIRGARDFNLYKTPIVIYPAGLRMNSATTLRATGNLVYGTVTYNTSGVTATVNGNASTTLSTAAALNPAANSFSMVANPYVAPVKWGDGGSNTNTVYGNSASSGINASYWYLDPTNGASGKYFAYNALTGPSTSGATLSYTYNPQYSNAAGYIQPGQAFFIENGSGSPVVQFTEATKGTTANLASVFGVTKPLSKLYVSLEKQETGVYSQVDGTAVAFANGFTNTAYGPQDARKFTGANDNLYISDKGMNLSIDGRLPATSSDAIALKISKPSSKDYQLKVDATNYINEGYTPLLFDALKNTTTPIATVDSFKFTVDTANKATYESRFTILFTPSALPVNSIVASASLNNKIATITWNTVGEKNVSRYEVEKSADAKTFTKIGQATAKNTATANYSTTENNVTATTYYRIKAVSTTGLISYSNVAKVQLAVNSNQFAVYPNPLVGKTLNVSLSGVNDGKYTVSIYNVLGEKVSEQSINHAGGGASHAITISNTLARGVYNVVIREVGSNQIVHETSLSVQP